MAGANSATLGRRPQAIPAGEDKVHTRLQDELLLVGPSRTNAAARSVTSAVPPIQPLEGAVSAALNRVCPPSDYIVGLKGWHGKAEPEMGHHLSQRT